MEYSLPIVLYGNILIPRLHHLFVKVEAEVEHLPFLNGGEGCANARFLFFFMGFVNSCIQTHTTCHTFMFSLMGG